MRVTQQLVGFVARLPVSIHSKFLVAFLTLVVLMISLGGLGLIVLGEAHGRAEDAANAVPLGDVTLPGLLRPVHPFAVREQRTDSTVSDRERGGVAAVVMFGNTRVGDLPATHRQ